jgi:riboflavin synthase
MLGADQQSDARVAPLLVEQFEEIRLTVAHLDQAGVRHLGGQVHQIAVVLNPCEGLLLLHGNGACGPIVLGRFGFRGKALRAHDRLGGHIVSGHVDGVGTVRSFEQVGESWELCLGIPATLARYLAFKGSITVNGVSLTVNRVTDHADGCDIRINLIPHTIENTALGHLAAGLRVNLEIDLIARYVERMLGAPAPTTGQGHS